MHIKLSRLFLAFIFILIEFSSFAGDPHWIQYEPEMIRSRRVLFQVIENLNLQPTWSERLNMSESLSFEKMFKLLKRKIEIRQSQRGRLVEVSVRSEDPVEAAKIANEISEVYVNLRNSRNMAILDIAQPPSRSTWSPSHQSEIRFLIMGLIGVGVGGYLIHSCKRYRIVGNALLFW